MQRPSRKHPRLKEYDYSLPGYYYVTIHNAQDAGPLSRIEGGLYPQVWLTEIGEIAQDQLLDLEKRYEYVNIDKYVIMPTHIHAIIRLREGNKTQEKRAGLAEILCAYKSIATRMINQKKDTPGRKQFQSSFYETVLRSERAYQACWLYIDGNPGKWFTDPDDL